MKTRNRIRLRVEELEGRLVPSTLAYSTNWSGYAVSTGAGAVSQVAGNWVVPAVSSSNSGYSSAWVGIDGWNSSSVEQIGTDSDYVGGQAYYYAWYEMYPAPAVNLSLSIHAGDKISASVNYNSLGQFVLSITDVSTGGSFSTIQTSSSAKRSSAEWIQEAPSSIGGVLPLANFGTINFSGANATVGGTSGPADTSWSGSTLNQTNMVTKTGALKASTSGLSDSGTPPTSSFSVTFVSSGASGSNGKGGHKSPNLPTPNLSQTTSGLSAAAVELAARLLETAPAPVATAPLTGTPSPSLTVAPLTGGAPSTAPASGAFTATLSSFGLDTANPDDQATAQPATQKLPPLPDDPAAPATPGAAPQADPAPAKGPENSPAMGKGGDATFTDDFWLSAPLLDGAGTTFNGEHEVPDIALAGLVLSLALERVWASAAQKQAGKPDRRSRSIRVK